VTSLPVALDCDAGRDRSQFVREEITLRDGDPRQVRCGQNSLKPNAALALADILRYCLEKEPRDKSNSY